MASSSSSSRMRARMPCLSRPRARRPVEEDVFDRETIPPSLAEIGRFFRVANEIAYANRRVAYLCCRHALREAERLDPLSRGAGVWGFKTELNRKLDDEVDSTQQRRIHESDAKEMSDFCCTYYNNYIGALQNPDPNADRDSLTVRLQSACTLFEVLKAVDGSGTHQHPDILEAHNKLKQMELSHYAYNILTLDADSVNQYAVHFPEILAAVYALRNLIGLPWPGIHEKTSDLFDWLGEKFRFQKGNIKNQREHLVLLLANSQMRLKPKPDQQNELDDRAVDAVMKKLFENYKKWCKYVGRKSNLRLPTFPQRKLLYTCLYLLIWGEAANLRFMPECLCYIFYHMAIDLNNMLTVSPMDGGSVKSAYGDDEEAFLNKVITPIYDVVKKEAERSKIVKSKHSHWRNYDDLNEYFWSTKCFLLGWPMKRDSDFFNTRLDGEGRSAGSVRWMGKVNFVEIRSFLHIFHSFDRMWIFLILCLQAQIIIAWNIGAPSEISYVGVLKHVLSIFITSAILNLVQAFLDIVFGWKARGNMSFATKLQQVFKLVSAALWVMILPVTYTYMWENLTDLAINIKSWHGIGHYHPWLYILAVVMYLAPNMLGAMLFDFPCSRRLLDRLNVQVIAFMTWWSTHASFVGKGINEDIFSFLMYTIFWVLLLAVKMITSYYVMIKPLVQSTKGLMREQIKSSQWHELFPHGNNNIGAVIVLWAPRLLVYFMDIQIWYTVFSTLIGGVLGTHRRLGEIRTLTLLRSRFNSLPDAINKCLIPSDSRKINGSREDSGDEQEQKKIASNFSQIWNLIIRSLREEDLVNNKEMNLLLVPYNTDHALNNMFQWPAFLLAGKVPMAVEMVANCGRRDHDLKKRLKFDQYFSFAISEAYVSFKNIINDLVLSEHDKSSIQETFRVVDEFIEKGKLIKDLKMRRIPDLCKKFVELLEFLQTNLAKDFGKVVGLLQEMIEMVSRDIFEGHAQLSGLLDSICGRDYRRGEGTTPVDQLFSKAIKFPMEESEAWTEKVTRVHFLLTATEYSTEVPTNAEARRRLLFFANSMFMEMPSATSVRNMLSFAVLTPYFREEVRYSSQQLCLPNEDGVSNISYLKTIFPDEWGNFQERVQCYDEEVIQQDSQLKEEFSLWASYRGQTLTRTVRGIMYYERVLELLAFLDTAQEIDPMEGYRAAETQCKTLSDLKFTYVISCQQYGIQKLQHDACAKEISELMKRYPSLRVAYVDEDEVPRQDSTRKAKKVYYSVLAKASPTGHDQVIYRIKLPGNPILGEGKPENQNHAIIFTRGECLQTIDMNQEHYMEEAFKMRNLLHEFEKRDGARNPSILGVRENIFTGSVSTLAWFMSKQETSFVTLSQRVLAKPLRVRFHYGHPDVFDRLFHLTRGGVSKASKTINLSEDVFGGFNSTLREGNVTYCEYVQVGKGRDVGINQLTLFEAKVANGNGEQTLSRDIYRLGHHFDFFRMLSCYYTTVGFYFSAMITVWALYAFLYGRLYLVLSGIDELLATGESFIHNGPLQISLNSPAFVQLGFLTALPMLMEMCVGDGCGSALREFLHMQLQFASVFFSFSLGTKVHYYGTTLLHGGAQYRATGRGFVVSHVKFAENYRLYCRSHFVKGIELMTLLVVDLIMGQPYRARILYNFITIYMWFLAISWLSAPFIFNPCGFDWQKIVDDWADWRMWMNHRGGIGVPPAKSWVSWWREEQKPLQQCGRRGNIVEFLLAMRFFLCQYGLVYHLDIVKNITNESHNILVYFMSLVIFFTILLIMKAVSAARRHSSARFQRALRLIKGSLFLALLIIVILLMASFGMTALDILLCILAFIQTSRGVLLVAQAISPVFKRLCLWKLVEDLAWGYDSLTGGLLFSAVAILAWFPAVSDFQTRLLFNQAFSRGLHISRILHKTTK